MTYHGQTLLALAMSSVLLSACSYGSVGTAATRGIGNQVEESSPSVSGDTGSGLPSEDAVEAYFQAASMYDVVALDRVMSLAEEGSVAEAYATHLLGYANASLDGGVPLSGALAVRTEEGYESCDGGECVTWGEIEGRDGRLVSFAVNGESLEERISVGNGKTVAAGELADVELVSAYGSAATGALDVVAEIRSGDSAILLGALEATNRSPDGRVSTIGRFVGTPALAENSMTTVLMSFPNADIGGVITVPVFSKESQEMRAAVLPTR